MQRLASFSGRGLTLPFLAMALTLWLAALPGRAESNQPNSSRPDIGEEIERQVQSDPRAALATAKSGLAAARAEGDLPTELRMLRLLVMAQVDFERSEKEVETIEAGLALAQRLNDAEAESELQIALGEHHAYRNRLQDAEAAYLRGEQIAKQAGVARQVVRAQYFRGLLYHSTAGRTSDAVALFGSALKTAEEIGDGFGAARALNGMALTGDSSRLGKTDHQRSIQLYRSALERIDPEVYASFAVTVMHNLGSALSNVGDRPAARATFEQALILAQRLQHKLAQAMLHWRLAGLDMSEGQPEQALAHLNVCEPLLDELGKLSMQFNVKLDRARALARLGQAQASLQALSMAEALLSQLNNARRDQSYFETAAAVHAQLGDMGEAYALMRRLRDADKAAATAANESLATELRTRFDIERREKDNELLRAQQRESDARRWMLVLALACALVLLCGTLLHLRTLLRQKRRLAELALSDELTRLPNRRCILDIAQRALRGRRDGSSSYFLAMLDVDHFKQVNDTHGHDVGDAVLRAFAQTCAALIRGSDTLGRFGGEEFLLVLPQCEPSNIVAVFGRLQRAVHGISVPNVDLGKELSFSMGIAAAGPQDSLEELVKRADLALYQAKQAGRDRFVLAPSGRDAQTDSASAGTTPPTKREIGRGSA